MARSKHAAEDAAAPKTPERPTKRMRTKSKGGASAKAEPVEPKAAAKPKPRAAAPAEPPRASAAAEPDHGASAAEPTVEVRQSHAPLGSDVCWENFAEIKAHFGLSEVDTIRVMTSLIGPRPKGFSLEATSASVKPDSMKPAHVKKEDEPNPPAAAPEEPPKNRRLRQMDYEPVDNQLGDPTMYPELHQDAYTTDLEATIVDEPEEGGEEEELDDDVEADEVGVPANGSNNDDQDSPQGGAAAEPAEEATGRPEPVEPVEPTLIPVEKPDDPAAVAKEQLQAALKSRPTPTRQGRQVVQAERIDYGENPPMKSLRSLTMFQITYVLVCMH